MSAPVSERVSVPVCTRLHLPPCRRPLGWSAVGEMALHPASLTPTSKAPHPRHSFSCQIRSRCPLGLCFSNSGLRHFGELGNEKCQSILVLSSHSEENVLWPNSHYFSCVCVNERERQTEVLLNRSWCKMYFLLFIVVQKKCLRKIAFSCRVPFYFKNFSFQLTV